MLTLVEYEYQPTPESVERIILAQREIDAYSPGRPVGIETWRSPTGVFTLDDESTQIIHPIVKRTILGRLWPTQGILAPNHEDRRVEVLREFREGRLPRVGGPFPPVRATANQARDE